jgi:DNA-directed RNA polymerase subunit RPC12/RpoP
MRCPKCGGKLEELTLTKYALPPSLLTLFHEKKLYCCAKCGHAVELSTWQRVWAAIKRR